jgi:UDP-N-acetylmuramoylalanine--D-glutamate ligase
MDLSFFKNKKITVYGLGLHGGGVGVVKFLAENGVNVIVTDLSSREKLAPSLEKLKSFKNIKYVLGQHRVEDFTNVDMVIKNPAIAWTDKHIKLALEKNVPVEMDSSLFFKLCKNKIIGVTGTKGKTTTAVLIYEILKSAGKSPVKVGIGQASVLDKLSLLKKDSVVVFELSSWRLSALGRSKLSPQIAVFKNIMPDHLNYYGTMEKYLKDKKYIFTNQKAKDFLIVNYDDEKLKEIAKEAPSQIIKFSYEPLKKSKSVFIDEENIYLNNGIDVIKLISVKNINIPGRHNLSNVMAAIGATYAFGLSPLEIKKALPNLKGPLHRLEFVREVDGAKYYNDTTATIPQAASSALRAFSQPIVLIAGGSDKELEFENLAKDITEKSKQVILLKGKATEKLLVQIKKFADEAFFQSIEIVDSMEKAVELARKFAEKGDVVLLSPGATSFGLFNNEFDRGEKFREAVRGLK